MEGVLLQTNSIDLFCRGPAADREENTCKAVRLSMLGSSRAQPERTCAQGLLINLLLVLIAGLQLDYHQRRQGCVEGGRQRESNDLLPLGL